MAKLKDIFPRWLFKERGFGDLDVGGSPLADYAVGVAGLAERFVVGTLGEYNDTGGYIEVGSEFAGTKGISFWHPTGAAHGDETQLILDSSFWDDGSTTFTIDRDGTHKWGSGTAAPDTTLQRYAGGGLVSVGQGISAANTADEGDQQAQIGADGTLYLQGDPSAHWLIIHPDGHVEHAGDSAFRFDNTISVLAHGGGLKLTSPDGTQTKTISIDNAGAIHVA